MPLCFAQLRLGLAMLLALGWVGTVTWPCHAKCNWQSEGSCFFSPASFRRNGTSGGSLMILCPQLELAWTQGTPFATLQSTRTTLSLKCRYMVVYLPGMAFMQRKLLCDESIWSTLYEICTRIHIKGYDYDLTYCQFGNFKYGNCLNCPQNGHWKRANGIIENMSKNRWMVIQIFFYKKLFRQ